MPGDDRVRMKHMLDSAREAVTSAKSHTRDSLAADHIWLLGIVKCVEIIGEAAARVSQPTREAHPAIPWAAIVAMRNRLVHGYDEIDIDQVWKTITDDLPPLIEKLERALSSN